MTDHSPFERLRAHLTTRASRSELRIAAIIALIVLAISAGILVTNRQLASGPPDISRPRDAFAGVGIWADWTELRGDNPEFTVKNIEMAADAGVTAFYLQVARQNGGDPLNNRTQLQELIAAAHDRDMRVIGWYLPTLQGNERDTEIAVAAKKIGVDALTLDIEYRDKGTAEERNKNLDALHTSLEKALGDDYPIAATVLPPVLFESVNPDWWGGTYPYESMLQRFDATLVMSYPVDRRGKYSDAYVEADADVAHLRDYAAKALVRDPQIHLITGYGDEFTPADAEAAALAAHERCLLGFSIYSPTTIDSNAWKAAIAQQQRDLDGCRPEECPPQGALTVPGIAFVPSSATIQEGAVPTLEAILNEINAALGSPTATASRPQITIAGHLDRLDAAVDKTELDDDRADALLEWFVERGVPRSRLSVTTWDARCPVASDTTSAGVAANSRVDISIVP